MSRREPRRVTVVVTTYNRERLVGPAIESVLASRFTDFELLVLDNCSADGTVEVARGYAARDSRVRVVVNESNLGQFGNRNRALEHVDTPFLKYHDSDDLMYPHCLDTMVRLIESAPSAGFALSAGKDWNGGPCPMLLTPRLAYEREFLGLGLFYCGPSGALFRTEVLRKLGGFPDKGVASDYCFWLNACAVTDVVLVPADLFWYRIHPGQEFQKESALREYASGHGDAWRALEADGCPLDGDALVVAKRNVVWHLLRFTWRDLRARRWSLIPLRFRSAGIRISDFVRYLPRRGRDRFAGTPLDASGDYLVPDWLRVSESYEKR